MALLLIFYKLFLEKENMHLFKRFFLLFSVIISLIIPFINLTTYIEPTTLVAPISIERGSSRSIYIEDEKIQFLPILLWSLYSLGVLFFSINFLRNLRSLILKIKNNPKLRKNGIIQVLLWEEIAPHTFWDYIFLNRQKFENHSIPPEVFRHEEAHAKQRHTIDILFIEFLQIIFWFNPLIYLIKNAVKLNHEFLADRAVLRSGADRTSYQKTLLSYSANPLSSNLANPINYSFIKKRFTVMKTTTSKKAMWTRILVILPIIAALFYGFSTKQIVEKPITDSSPVSQTKILELRIDEEGLIFHDNHKLSFKETMELADPENYSDVSINVFIYAPKKITDRLITSMIEKGYTGSLKFCTYGESEPGKTDVFSQIFDIKTIQETATPEMVEEYNQLAKYYNSLPEDDAVYNSEEIERMKYIYSLMTPEQKENAEKFPATLPPPPPPAPPVPPAPNRSPDAEMLNPPIPDPPPAPAAAQNIEPAEVPAAPPPPIEHIRELASQDAKFYLNGKKITSEEAIKMVKKKEDLHIRVTGSGSDPKTVNLFSQD
ncbi:MAG TPA: M56 family metallopeptidase [Salinimicrobium sp.]|nr:M56 family metallopeptidase [Salinimicrobium sp.]